MGQRANGILYGCECPVLPDPDGGGEPEYDLICRWEKAKKIDPFREGLRIRTESEGDKRLIGVWVAVGGSGEDGAPYFLEKCMTLADVPSAYAKSIARAEKLWARFADWAEKKEGLKLPAPQLWLTPCETA